MKFNWIKRIFFKKKIPKKVKKLMYFFKYYKPLKHSTSVDVLGRDYSDIWLVGPEGTCLINHNGKEDHPWQELQLEKLWQ